MYQKQAMPVAQTPSQKPKVTINLEDAVLQEQKINQILESLRNNLNASLYCDDWWDVTETGHIASIIAFQVLKDNNLREALLQAQKLETISIGIVQFYHLLAYEQNTIDSQTSVNTYLKNLMFQIQQNFLIIIRLTLARIVNDNPSSWEVQLHNIVEQKLQKKVTNKDEITQMLRVYCANAENIILNICKTNSRKHIFQII